MDQRAEAFQQQLQQEFPERNLELPEVTTNVRFTYILSFVFFSLFFIAAAAYLSHLATRRINTSIQQFQRDVKSIETARDLKNFNAQPDTFVFSELGEAFASVNQLARRLEKILVDKSLLEDALEEAEREDSMAADILYGHLIEKNADNPLGIMHRIQSSSNFSGDIVLVRRSPSGSIFVLLADATGHGLSATITIMPVISVFDTMVKKGHRLPFILREMNKRLLKDLPDDRFVAATLIEIDPTDQELRLWNGGMPEGFLLDGRSTPVQGFRSRHMALGILEDALFDAAPERLPLPDQGYLLSYSDGLIEQDNPEGEAFAETGLLKAIRHHPAKNLITGLLGDVEQHAGKPIPDDDISLLLLDFKRLHSSLMPAEESCRISDLTLPAAPFQWQIRVQGEQLINQAIPALTNDFLHTLGLDPEVIQKVFTVAHELTSRALHDNLLQLPAELKQDLLEEEGERGLQYYYQQRREALSRLDPDSFMEVKLASHPGRDGQAGYLEIEVRDNGQGQGRSLLEDHSLFWHYSQVEILDEGHFIRAHL
ncbi:PP2C family protein-serine/threonine phosphatase [Marinospirillum sp.]|uniref:PP2C family protein-serine/threonine phosphatase n=1 Tax=Marinospirillum sp. TaxID=2183934 RepID=UPI00384BA46B